MRSNRIAKSVAALALVGALAAGSVHAQSTAANFYKGKTVTVWVGYTAGGGYDIYARTFARHWGKHLAGNPDFIVRNRPGAGSLLLTNEVYNILPKDGTAVAVVARGMAQERILGNEQAKYDASKFTWIGSANNEVSVCVSWAKSGVTRFQELKTRGMIVGGTGDGADTDNFPKALNKILGTKLKLVTGYPGGNEIMLAMERGEVEGRCGYSWSSATTTHADWLRDKKMNVLVQIALQKHRDMPNVPLITELADNAEDRAVLEFIFAGQVWGRPFLAPPGIPADRVQALQESFMAVTKDPVFIAEVTKQKLEVNPVSGPEVARLVGIQHKASPVVIKRAKEATD
jgi:tripartite-type tricarboxylate transporter receptor subunit TctC